MRREVLNGTVSVIDATSELCRYLFKKAIADEVLLLVHKEIIESMMAEVLGERRLLWLLLTWK